jgi:hypothetical protein
MADSGQGAGEDLNDASREMAPDAKRNAMLSMVRGFGRRNRCGSARCFAVKSVGRLRSLSGRGNSKDAASRIYPSEPSNELLDIVGAMLFTEARLGCGPPSQSRGFSLALAAGRLPIGSRLPTCPTSEGRSFYLSLMPLPRPS